MKSSEESLDEAKQKKLWELSGGYLHLEGFEALEVPTPPPEPVKEEPKPEPKPEEHAGVNGEAAKPAAGEQEIQTTADEADKPKEIIEDGNNAKVDESESDNKTEEKKDAEKENKE